MKKVFLARGRAPWMQAFALATVGLVMACNPPAGADTAQADFDTNCAACHGSSGQGDGPMAAELTRTPADLTMLRSGNGGVFPRVRVMSVIDGYAREGQHGAVMPSFGAEMLGGETVLVDTGDGVMTPTPVRLVKLAQYIEGLQR